MGGDLLGGAADVDVVGGAIAGGVGGDGGGGGHGAHGGGHFCCGEGVGVAAAVLRKNNGRILYQDLFLQLTICMLEKCLYTHSTQSAKDCSIISDSIDYSLAVRTVHAIRMSNKIFFDMTSTTKAAGARPKKQGWETK